MKRHVLILLVVLLVIGAQCPGGAAPTLTPEPTPTPQPTLTPTPAPCSVQAAAYIAAVEKIFDDWDDANALARNTPRSSLAVPISQLQEIRRGVDDLSRPPCTDIPHKLLLDYMDRMINAYIAFMGGSSDAGVRLQMSVANDKLNLWQQEFAKLKAGAEPYDR